MKFFWIKINGYGKKHKKIELKAFKCVLSAISQKRMRIRKIANKTMRNEFLCVFLTFDIILKIRHAYGKVYHLNIQNSTKII